jgi:predicted nucleic acid-binding protein
MRYVLDSCVALKWVLPESDSDKAIQVRDDANAGIHELFAPDIYDCLYLALAERERCKHLTADDRLIRALQPTFPFITSLASLP